MYVEGLSLGCVVPAGLGRGLTYRASTGTFHAFVGRALRGR